jgi:hypothetical protein
MLRPTLDESPGDRQKPLLHTDDFSEREAS